VGVEWISFSSLKSRLNNSFEASLSAPSDYRGIFYEWRSHAKLLRKRTQDAAFGKSCSTKDNRRRASQCNTKANLPGFEIASVFVRLDHIASAIVNANHGLM
jgi:hypothetical protein